MVGELALPLAGAFVLGGIVGSFLNVAIHRLPRGESLVRPASHCPACGRPVRPWENVPLLSYLWLRGRCAGCGVRIPLRYPAVECATGVLFAAIVWRHGLGPMTPLWLLFGAALLAAAWIDSEHRIIPDEISLGGLGAGLVGVPLARLATGDTLAAALLPSLAGALLGAGTLWLVGFVHARVSVALGRSFEHWPGPGEAPPRPGSLDYWTWFPGMGLGDVKLLAMIGAFLGPWGVFATIFVASVLGLLLGVVLGLVARRWNVPYGFGPALAAAALLVMLLPRGLELL
jgi:leader peptidase (prepilin peptidase)/N-methyltransferase